MAPRRPGRTPSARRAPFAGTGAGPRDTSDRRIRPSRSQTSVSRSSTRLGHAGPRGDLAHPPSGGRTVHRQPPLRRWARRSAPAVRCRDRVTRTPGDCVVASAAGVADTDQRRDRADRPRLPRRRPVMVDRRCHSGGHHAPRRGLHGGRGDSGLHARHASDGGRPDARRRCRSVSRAGARRSRDASWVERCCGRRHLALRRRFRAAPPLGCRPSGADVDGGGTRRHDLRRTGLGVDPRCADGDGCSHRRGRGAVASGVSGGRPAAGALRPSAPARRGVVAGRRRPRRRLVGGRGDPLAALGARRDRRWRGDVRPPPRP